MNQPTIVTDPQIEQAIASIPGDAFTILDFIRVFADRFPTEWALLQATFGERGDGSRRHYTAATYLGNRLSQFTKRPESPLLPMVKWQAGGVETPNQRVATAEERRMGADRIIRVFRKRVP